MTPDHDPISDVDHQILALFREQLAELRFPDLDTTQLETAADVVYAAQVEVEALEQALAEARMRVLASVQSLHVLAERGLAYASVYAMGKSMEAQVQAIRQAASSERSPSIPQREARSEADSTRRRGRPRKDATASLLPMTEAPSSSGDVEATPAEEASTGDFSAQAAE